MVDRFIGKLEHVAASAKDPSWWKYANVIGMELDAELERLRTFAVRSSRVLDDAVEFELEWRGRGRSISDVRRDVYGLCGRIGEEAAFINCVVGEHAVQFDVLIGCHTRDVHGHGLWLRLVGERIRQVIAGYGGQKNRPG